MNSEYDFWLDRQHQEYTEQEEQQRQDEEEELYRLEEVLAKITNAEILTEDEEYLLKRNLRLL